VTTAASAPAKVILLGEHGVNRRQPALAAAVSLRAYCRVDSLDGRYRIASALACDGGTMEELARFVSRVDQLIQLERREDIRTLVAADRLAPVRYVLGRLGTQFGIAGIAIDVESQIPVGAGLGSGAAVSCALAVAASKACLSPTEVAAVGWSGDVLAHGGVASGLDSSACALGGIVSYSLADGPVPVSPSARLTIVVSDTGVSASTASVNAAVQAAVEADPAKEAIFEQIGALVKDATDALSRGDLKRLGARMDANQELLSELGVSSPENDELVAAARRAGALGAKVSGSGGGGIVIALCADGTETGIAAAMTAAGGSSMVLAAAVDGARLEAAPSPSNAEELIGNPG
jgi:mevalonate kinase